MNSFLMLAAMLTPTQPPAHLYTDKGPAVITSPQKTICPHCDHGSKTTTARTTTLPCCTECGGDCKCNSTCGCGTKIAKTGTVGLCPTCQNSMCGQTVAVTAKTMSPSEALKQQVEQAIASLERSRQETDLEIARLRQMLTPTTPKPVEIGRTELRNETDTVTPLLQQLVAEVRKGRDELKKMEERLAKLEQDQASTAQTAPAKKGKKKPTVIK